MSESISSPFGGYDQSKEVCVEDEKVDVDLAKTSDDGVDDNLISQLNELENC